MPFVMVSGMLFLAGQIAFDIATSQARIYPRAAALVLGSGVALPIALLLPRTVKGLLIIAGTTVLGVPLTVLGKALLVSAGVDSPEHQPLRA